MTSDLELLNLDLDALGATQFQRDQLQRDSTRARAALAEAMKRGAGQPLSYAISLFHSENFTPRQPKLTVATNAHVLGDPKISDDGQRIWHASEVDAQWRHEYLRACIDSYLGDEDENDVPRYEPSNAEWTGWMRLMKERVPHLRLAPTDMRWSAAHALAAWAELWQFEDLLTAVAPAVADDDDGIPF